MYRVLETWFAHPTLLAALAAGPLLALLFIWAWLRRRRALALLGVRRHVLLRSGVRRWRGLCLLAGTLLLALACAGPQWGREPGLVRSASDDVVVVLDLSRSMQAEQPSRRERALWLLRDLADTLEKRGGRRVALVVFAAEPRLMFPLTQDYDHFRHCLKQVAEDDLAPLMPGPDVPFSSGTRFGAALRLAVESHDRTRAGKQAILLLSDGDDPAAADEEWLQGVLAARALGVHIHTVGVGDPDKARSIPDGGDVLRFQGKVVTTQLNEALLQEMARRTGGAYIPAHNYAVPLGMLVQNLLQQQSPEAETSDDALPVHRQQFAWFLAPALALLLLSLLMNEGPTLPRRSPALASVVAVLLLGAVGPPDTDPLLREGNAAFGAGDFAAALRFYEEAERSATDPGLVAFNKAAACYRLGRYAEAVAGYRQCLEDDQAPAERRARAWYDFGTALVKQSGGTSAPLLRQAVSGFRACLALPDLSADLHADARHNLELAQMLWLKARAANPNDPPDGGEDRPPDNQLKKPNGPDKDNNNGKDDPGPRSKSDQTKQDGNKGSGAAGNGNKDKVKAGALQVLPDTDQVVPLPPEETDAHLDSIIERIVQERRSHWQKSAQAPKDARNW